MVKKQFVSKHDSGADAWRWPVFAKSESEFENILTSASPFTILPVVFPAFSILFLFIFWILYHLKILELRTLKLFALVAGSLWFAFGYFFGIKVVLYELFCSVFYKMPQHNFVEVSLLFFSRQIFFVSASMIFWILYNRRMVNPDKVHYKVYVRQRHERVRLVRIWHKTIELPEVL